MIPARVEAVKNIRTAMELVSKQFKVQFRKINTVK